MTPDRTEEQYRGAPLAKDASPETTPPDPDELGKGGLRGDGLADDAAPDGPGPDPAETSKDGIRGDGLAEEG